MKTLIADEQLTSDQLQIAQRVLSGESLFLTGPAGSGKSFLFRYLIQELLKKFLNHSSESLAITAPTGIAAINVNGQTIHSWAGVGLGRGDVNDLVKKVRKSIQVTQRWSACQVLLIDEISMLNYELFEKLSTIGRRIRNCPLQAFGGIQVVCCGDFFQLPPVGLEKFSDYCFKAPSWKELNMNTVALTEVIRQSGDTLFINM